MTNQYATPRKTFGTTLRFTPYAWAKLMFMQRAGKTEVAGCGITGTSDPLLVTDFVLISQRCSFVTFDLDTEDLADHLDRMMDIGLAPWQVSNILIHTHPGKSPDPSSVDEDNFASAFSKPDWAIMMIIAEDGKTYCRLKLNTGPGVTKMLNVSVDWSQPFAGSQLDIWAGEYKAKVNAIDSPLRENGADFTVEADGSVSVWDEDDAMWYWYDPASKKWFVEDGLEYKEIDAPHRSWTKKAIKLLNNNTTATGNKS